MGRTTIHTMYNGERRRVILCHYLLWWWESQLSCYDALHFWFSLIQFIASWEHCSKVSRSIRTSNMCITVYDLPTDYHVYYVYPVKGRDRGEKLFLPCGCAVKELYFIPCMLENHHWQILLCMVVCMCKSWSIYNMNCPCETRRGFNRFEKPVKCILYSSAEEWKRFAWQRTWK